MSSTSFRRLCLLLPVLGMIGMPLPAAEPNGSELYQSQCAKCHGNAGEGTKKFSRRLEGELSVLQLADVIRETMPEDNPESLSPEQAQAIARFMHNGFYSSVARERNKPARIELSRLTVRQYRNALADLVGSFRGGPMNWEGERGLKAEYFKARNFNKDNRVLERVDPQIDFQFGTEAPVAEKIEPHEFSIRWNGAIYAPVTGEYQFVIRTEHAVRVWLNDNRDPLIDAWVKSGTDTEFSGRITLIAGRIYPLRIEFSKAKQGVNDSDKQKKPPPSLPASIAFLWQPPQGVLETVPSRQLSVNWAAEQFVSETPFPPDDRSYGWERGTAISKEWDQATTAGAIEVAGFLSRKINQLANTKEDDSERPNKIREFARKFAERAFRRPLTAEQTAVLIDKQFSAVSDPVLALKRTVVLTLKSPEFLFREVTDQNDAFDVASRLSFGLWDSIPDQQLWNAAAENRLGNREQVTREAERMLRDVRAQYKLRQFLLTWLKADEGHDLSKNPEKFPGFDPAVISDLKASLILSLDEVLRSDGADFRQFLSQEQIYLSDRLAKYYGLEPTGKPEFTPVAWNTGRGAGLLTHPYLMATFAHTDESSPILRGVFLMRGVLGQGLRPPPDAVTPLPPDLHPDLTTRERVILQTKGATCMTCHSLINPLGFTLERFDAVGRYREQDRNKPIDSTGSYRDPEGKLVNFDGARQLAQYVAESRASHQSFATQMFHFLVQQSVRAYGDETQAELTRKFEEQQFNIRKLAVEVMVSAALQSRNEAIAAK